MIREVEFDFNKGEYTVTDDGLTWFVAYNLHPMDRLLDDYIDSFMPLVYKRSPDK